MDGLDLYQDVVESGTGVVVAFLNGVEAARLFYILHDDEIMVQTLEAADVAEESILGPIMIQWLKEQSPGMVVDYGRISQPMNLEASTTSGYLPVIGGDIEAPRKHARVVFGAYLPTPKTLLVSQRRLSQTFPGQWELPNGRVLNEEPDAVALTRAWKKKLGVDVQVEEQLAELDFIPAPDIVMDIVIYRVRLPKGVRPRPLDAMALKVVSLKEAEKLDALISITATLDVLAGKPPTTRCSFVRTRPS